MSPPAPAPFVPWILRLLAWAVGVSLLAAWSGPASARAATARSERVETPVATLQGVRVRLEWPAGADRGHRDRYYHVPKHRTVVHHVYHRPAPPPRRVVVVHHAPRPAPVVYHQQAHPHNGAAILVGAVLGAAILHHVVTGY